jgi:hypothetical protein
MNKWFFSCLILLAACTEKKEPILSPAQQKARIDSIVTAEHQELIKLEQERLKDRMSIELREKVDSILESNRPKIVAPIPPSVPIADSITPKIDTNILTPLPL